MKEHPKHKGYYASDDGNIITPSNNTLKPLYINTQYKTIVNGKRISYNRFLKECEIGRELCKDEVVYPIDGDQENRRISNLDIRSKSEHQRLVMEKRWQK